MEEEKTTQIEKLILTLKKDILNIDHAPTIESVYKSILNLYKVKESLEEFESLMESFAISFDYGADELLDGYDEDNEIIMWLDNGVGIVFKFDEKKIFITFNPFKENNRELKEERDIVEYYYIFIKNLLKKVEYFSDFVFEMEF